MPQLSDTRKEPAFVQFHRVLIQDKLHLGICFVFQPSAIFLKAVEIGMYPQFGIHNKGSILADDQLFQADNRKRTANAIDHIIEELIGAVRIPKMVNNIHELVKGNGAVMVQQQIRQQQIALLCLYRRRSTFLSANNLHATEKVDMNIIFAVF